MPEQAEEGGEHLGGGVALGDAALEVGGGHLDEDALHDAHQGLADVGLGALLRVALEQGIIDGLLKV